MSAFKDVSAAERSYERIGAMTSRDVRPFLVSAAESSSNPDAAVANFERWVAATSTPTTYFDSLAAAPAMGRIIVSLLGASHQLSNVLVQNPEIAALVFDTELLQTLPDPCELDRELVSLLANANNYSHALDRLRYFKQSWLLRIAACDLAGLWEEEQVWRALSDVADVLVARAASVVWSDIAGHEDCPVSIIAMGKLGGRELNFSSDIDLVFVLADSAKEEEERPATKFAEAMSRALSDRMGRGALYRVDLRLRPYGGKGELTPRAGAVESYYENFAEPWEHLAMLRSRVVFGPEQTARRWEALRERTCFKKTRGEWFVQEIADMRARIDSQSDENDIKRSNGGIRDVEFVAQVYQILYGSRQDFKGVYSTCETLRLLEEKRLLTRDAAMGLAESYTFLRQVEHRMQLLGGLQTHVVPSDIDERTALSLRSGFQNVALFDSVLALHRSRISEVYSRVLDTTKKKSVTSRSSVLDSIPETANIVSSWIDALPASDQFYQSLRENESSLIRVSRIALHAPAIVPMLKNDVLMTELVLSGEVLEHALGAEYVTTPDLATSIKRSWLRPAITWALVDDADFATSLTAAMDAVLLSLLERCAVPLRAVALGSYGSTDLLPFSDLDIILFRDSETDAEQAEKSAQSFLASVQSARESGAPFEVDVRLRPEGKKGFLTVSESSLEQYASSSMQTWERLALGRARSIEGKVPAALSAAAFGHPFDRETADSLRAMKSRVERERVPANMRRRHIKLGPGGQDDIVWLVQTLWWKHRVDLKRQRAISISERLSSLCESGLIDSQSRETLDGAWKTFMAVRTRLALSGKNDEAYPSEGFAVEEYESTAAKVRLIFQDTLAGL